MLVMVAFAIMWIGLIIPYLKKRKRYKNLIITLISIMIGAIFFGSAVFIYYSSYEETRDTTEYELNTLSNKDYVTVDGTEKMFYVYVSSNNKYYDKCYAFFYNDNGSEQKVEEIPYNKVNIYEQDEYIPHIVKHTIDKKNDIINEIWDDILMFGQASYSYDTYDIYIPKGTIAERYTGLPIVVQEQNVDIE